MPYRDPMEWERRAFPFLKKIWIKIKSSELFNRFRHSDLNPYHRGIPKIEADTLKEAKQMARQKFIKQIKNTSLEERLQKCRKAKEAYRQKRG